MKGVDYENDDSAEPIVFRAELEKVTCTRKSIDGEIAVVAGIQLKGFVPLELRQALLDAQESDAVLITVTRMRKVEREDPQQGLGFGGGGGRGRAH